MVFLPQRRQLMLAGGAATVLALAGCAAQTALIRDTPPAGLPRRVELSATPYYPQDDYQCGPAALAMALGPAGFAVRPEALAGQVFLPGRHGSLQIEMLSGARRTGALAVEVPGTLEALMRETAAGHPVVALLNLGLAWAPTWHYAVVIGYDLDEAAFLLRSGPMERQVLPFRTFELTWVRAGAWAFVALPAGQLAASADEAATTRALVAFEKAAPPGKAAPAYRAALARWPDSLTLAMGLGNSLYAAGDRPGAEAAFREAARRHASAAAWNNLAVILLEAGRIDAARAAARRAIELGGSTIDAARDTLKRIDAVR
ncbi:PA2778 family cysteine peptidase [Zoogloea sp.]|uniref:PA2778 family cysteine peptidase n=1 Tax=Zoogloea sp. TaxID=49181 RepID=UPI002587232C|nr:PA2778 family cysteine peptidase [Zoogloea sp.]MDD2669541.1 PA2778 family cysteine peptidase [Zoogloea sp.]